MMLESRIKFWAGIQRWAFRHQCRLLARYQREFPPVVFRNCTAYGNTGGLRIPTTKADDVPGNMTPEKLTAIAVILGECGYHLTHGKDVYNWAEWVRTHAGQKSV